MVLARAHIHILQFLPGVVNIVVSVPALSNNDNGRTEDLQVRVGLHGQLDQLVLVPTAKESRLFVSNTSRRPCNDATSYYSGPPGELPLPSSYPAIDA